MMVGFPRVTHGQLSHTAVDERVLGRHETHTGGFLDCGFDRWLLGEVDGFEFFIRLDGYGDVVVMDAYAQPGSRIGQPGCHHERV